MATEQPDNVLDKGQIPFQAEGRLLQELGLRLVASPEVALVELIKNSYDADSPTCTVRLDDNGQTLVVADEGHGMTFADFKTRWMRIATSRKVKEETSPNYHRSLTGAKGIGRFAVRSLGDHLTLQSSAFDKERGFMTLLSAVFDWPKLDSVEDMSKTAVAYQLVQAPSDTSAGTTLIIRKLRSTADFTKSKELRNDVLRIVSPIQGLESGKFANVQRAKGKDPGFKVILPGESESEDVDLAKMVLDNYWARLTIELKDKELQFCVRFSTGTKPKTLNVRVATAISKGFWADIRFFPRRAGVFHGKGINGQLAWQWVRDNCGVAVVDHGFRMKPFGFPDDDWLSLDRDKAHNLREWRTSIAQKHFSISPAIKADPAENPMLNLPYNFQLVGAVFILSHPALNAKDQTDLISAMDREGLLENAAFEELRDYIRAGVEFLAHEDKAEKDRLAREEAKEAARTAREDIQKAIEHIEQSPTLAPTDKSRIVKQYRVLADRVDEQEEYSIQARRSMMTMSLLGVVAGFMTHESKAIMHELDQAVEQVRALGRKHPAMIEIADELSTRLDSFKDYLEYARMFVQNVREPRNQPLSASGQVRLVLNRFKSFAHDRGIKLSSEIPDGVMTPPLPVTAYSGVLLNLFTNALKAVTAAKASVSKPHICFRAWNEKGKHIVEILDNGIGIPPEMRKRIWDPLYTTTSDIGNPLGSGMGLGLTLIKQVIEELGGSISIVPDPPAGFTTCFRVIFSK